ncbi:hypothetical protein CWN98_21135 [Vibrio splendidus]|uniref:hypothetical protein n=1 Tax=Vibrio splendidus TaxID=29497 RepID=UPI000374AEAD|nr:hypothetical protein CWN81_21710 [Vibrio splendidus]PTO67081.1 hypothetical protein CWN96_10970 [Vibrio splendidus]PTO81610.1 hypothetical protein CWN98_21135 [Vibrio splendidus]PTP45801.1 hypothetical protein CWO10_16090 [Vibrio splendidus]PTP85597.1 hypothetical protein CWO02_20120 [Vibrio splendidus]
MWSNTYLKEQVMAREISFKNNGTHWNVVLSMTISYVIVSLAISFFYHTELQFFSFVTSIIIMVAFYALASRFTKSNLSLVGEDVYLHGIKADLVIKNSVFARQYIQVKSLTKKGYYKVNIREGRVAKSDWEMLLSKASLQNV